MTVAIEGEADHGEAMPDDEDPEQMQAAPTGDTALHRGGAGREGPCCPCRVPRASHAALDLLPDRDPVAILAAQAPSRVPELVPIRYGRMLRLAVHLLSRRGGGDGADLSNTPRAGSAGAALRRCTSRELRRLRVAGADARLRPQRLRRDAPRPVRVGREATRGQLRDRRARPRLHRSPAQDCRRRRRPRLPRVDAAVRDDEQPRALVLATRRGRVGGGATPPPGDEAGAEDRADRGEGADEGQHEGVLEAHAGQSTASADRLGSAAHRPHRESSPQEPGSPSRRSSRSSTPSTATIGDRCSAIAATCSSSSRWSTWRARSSASAVSGRAACILLLLGLDNGDPLFLQIKEAQESVLEPHPRQDRVLEPRPTGRRGTATDASGERHLPRLAARRPDARRQSSRLLLPPALGLEDVGRPGHDPAEGSRGLCRGVRVDARPCARAFRRPRRDRHTWARARSSTVPSPTSRWRTPTSTRATMPHCARRSTRAASRRRRAPSLDHIGGRRDDESDVPPPRSGRAMPRHVTASCQPDRERWPRTLPSPWVNHRPSVCPPLSRNHPI